MDFNFFQVIVHFTIDSIVDVSKLDAEISNLHLRLKDTLQAIETTGVLYSNSKIFGKLLQWCSAVCSVYGVQVTNFSSSFSDGRALLCILHHYFPQLVTIESIQLETTTTHGWNIDADKPDELRSTMEAWAASFSPGRGKVVGRSRQRLLANEKSNFSLFGRKLKEIGTVFFISVVAVVVRVEFIYSPRK